MKKLFSLIIAFSIFCNISLADCDWSTIKDNGNGTYTYSRECHIKVGEMVQDIKIKDQQLTLLNKSIELKDLALGKADDRINLWRETAYKLDDKVTAIDKLQSKNNFLYFGLGIATAIASGWMASRLIK